MVKKSTKSSDDKKQRVKIHMMSATHEILEAASGVFSIFKNKSADNDKKYTNMANLFEKGIFITEELQRGLLSFIDKLEEELNKDNNIPMGEKNDKR
ncbi:MAG: hypothetical protein ABIE74_08050 [Pseudomonadota bacterium]